MHIKTITIQLPMRSPGKAGPMDKVHPTPDLPARIQEDRLTVYALHPLGCQWEAISCHNRASRQLDSCPLTTHTIRLMPVRIRLDIL